MQGQRRKSARMREQRVGEMHIHFGHKKRCQQLGQFGRHLTQLDDDHRANAKWHIVLVEKSFDLVGIAHHDPRDRGVRRFRDAQGHDMGIMRVQ